MQTGHQILAAGIGDKQFYGRKNAAEARMRPNN